MRPQTVFGRLLVRLAFLFVVSIGIVQYPVRSLLGEPYPSLFMPGFAGAGGFAEWTVSAKSFEAVFVNSASQEFTFDSGRFLSDFPDSHHGTISRFLSPLPEGQTWATLPSRREGLRYKVFPGLRQGLVDRSGCDKLRSLQAWLSQRGAELVPGEHLVKVEIRWFTEVYSIEEGRQVVQRESDGKLVIGLEGIDR